MLNKRGIIIHHVRVILESPSVVRKLYLFTVLRSMPETAFRPTLLLKSQFVFNLYPIQIDRQHFQDEETADNTGPFLASLQLCPIKSHVDLRIAESKQNQRKKSKNDFAMRETVVYKGPIAPG